MLRTLQNSPVHFPILETGLLIRHMAETSSNMTQFLAKCHFSTSLWGNPSKGCKHRNRKWGREEKKGSKGCLNVKARSISSASPCSLSVNSGSTHEAKLVSEVQAGGLISCLLNTLSYRWYLAPCVMEDTALYIANVSGTPQLKGSSGGDSWAS